MKCYKLNVAYNFYATIHRHPTIHRYNVRFHDEFCLQWFRQFVIRTENNQIALIIIQPIWNSLFLRLLFIFDAAIFLTKFRPKINL